jgi:hypothetical protein
MHEDSEEDGGDDREQAKLDAADALIEAVHSKDAHAVVEAWGALCDLHEEEYEEGEQEG